jgi:hypothetical protein
VSTIREQVSDALLRTGTDLAIDRVATTRNIEADPRYVGGYDAATSAMMLAGWVDSAILWLSWRLRPRTFRRPM